MEVTDGGIVTEVREVQPWKALAPMDVTVEGIFTDFSEVQPAKAFATILFPPAVSVTFESMQGHEKYEDDAN